MKTIKTRVQISNGLDTYVMTVTVHGFQLGEDDSKSVTVDDVRIEFEGEVLSVEVSEAEAITPAPWASAGRLNG